MGTASWDPRTQLHLLCQIMSVLPRQVLGYSAKKVLIPDEWIQKKVQGWGQVCWNGEHPNHCLASPPHLPNEDLQTSLTPIKGGIQHQDQNTHYWVESALTLTATLVSSRSSYSVASLVRLGSRIKTVFMLYESHSTLKRHCKKMLDNLFIYSVLRNELPPHPNMLLKVIRPTSPLSCWAVDERLSDDKTLRGSCSLERDRSCLRASFIARTALNICRSKLYIRT